MQQTDKYKLDLIEKTDTFSPDPLNGNMEKVENALITHEGLVEEVTDALAEQAAALDARVTVLEARRMVIGQYTPVNNSTTEIDLGFDPIAVLIVSGYQGTYSGILLPGLQSRLGAMLKPNGFTAGYASESGNLNHRGETYVYIALG